jgi:hypothetical protein
MVIFPTFRFELFIYFLRRLNDTLSRYYIALLVVKFLDDFKIFIPYLFGQFLSQITTFI